MALTESIEYDKIEVVGQYKAVQVRKATVIKRDGVEIQGARSFERYVLESSGFVTDAETEVVSVVDTDISAEPAEIQAVCNAVWTTDVKAAWKAKLEADKPAE